MVSKLTKRDAAFLEKHGVPLAAVFDATGLPSREWKSAMKEQGKLIAYGVSCLRGHSLKTRHGNCVRCNTANFAFALRSEREGFVYVARSDALNLMKVGFSAEDPENRIYIANLEGYGGTSDWEMMACFHAVNAGRVELMTHSALREFAAPRVWLRNWREVVARELYDCSFEVAENALRVALADMGEQKLARSVRS